MVWIPPSVAIGAGVDVVQTGINYFADKAADERARKQTEAANRNRLLAQQYRFDAWNERRIALEEAERRDIAQLENDYKSALTEVQRATESGLTRLADLSDNLIAKAESRQRSLARVQGRYSATGQTGKTTTRLENLPKGEAGRQTALDDAGMERAEGAFLFNQKRVNQQAKAYVESRYNQQMAKNYDPGPAPFFEGLLDTPAPTATKNLIKGLFGAVGNLAVGTAKANEAKALANRNSLSTTPTPAPAAPTPSIDTTTPLSAPPPGGLGAVPYGTPVTLDFAPFLMEPGPRYSY